MPRAPKPTREAARSKPRGRSGRPSAGTSDGAAWQALVARLTAACEALAGEAPRLVESLRELSLQRSAPPGRAPQATRQRIEQAGALLDGARRTLVEALDTLPRDGDYAAVARQLRELATVSPSLMEWLRQVPRLSTPLVASAKGLEDAAAGLASARDCLEDAIRELWPEG